MFKRIMVPTDGSPESDRAIPVAEQLAKANDAEVLLVQAVKFPVITEAYGYDGMGSADVYQEMLDLFEEEAQSNLDRLTTRLRESGVRVTATKLEGMSPAANLLDFESQHHPDLVVMASHGRTGLARFAPEYC